MLSSRRTVNHFTTTHLQSLAALTRRFYYAERYASLPKSKARIKKHSNAEFTLQALTSLHVGERLFDHTTWRDQLFGRNWRNILIISDNDTLSYEKAYAINKTPSSASETTHPINIINIKTLYAIPQETWDAFMDKLKIQPLVEKLNLRKHRHLWAAYNQHRHAPTEMRIKHGEWIGKYHFLISLSHLHDTISMSSPDRSHFQEAIDRFQLLGFQDESPLEIFKTFHPALTPLFFKKVAHIATLTDVLSLACLVGNYAAAYPRSYPNHHLINPNQLLNAINWLPSSKEPDDADKTEAVHRLSVSFKYSLNSLLFFTARKNWSTATQYASLIEDYLNALFQDLLSRETVNILKKNNVSEAMQDRLYEKFTFLFQKIVADHCTYTQLDALQARWHINLQRIESAKPLAETNPSWEPLTEPQTINDITISAITHDQALKEHGEKMQHCVGTYTQACLKNDADIFEMTDAQSHCSTLEIWHYGDRYHSQQHRTYKDAMPSAQHVAAATQFIQGLNNGSIHINSARRLDSGIVLPSRHYTDEEQAKIYAAYCELKLLPAKLVAPNYQAFIEKIGLNTLVQETIRIAHLPDVREEDDKLDQDVERTARCSIM